jgi:hypothetical protein
VAIGCSVAAALVAVADALPVVGIDVLSGVVALGVAGALWHALRRHTSAINENRTRRRTRRFDGVCGCLLIE